VASRTRELELRDEIRRGVGRWPATRAARVNGTLLRIGWQLKRQAGGSHRTIAAFR